MKKRFWLLAFATFYSATLVGCGSVRSFLSDFNMGISDPDVVAQAHNLTTAVVDSVGVINGLVPGINAIGPLLGSIAGIVAIVVGGVMYKKRKDKKW